MAVTDHYDFWHLDPDEEISDFPSTWNYNIDDIDAAIHAAATDPVAVSRVPKLPASQIDSGKFAQARIPNLPASQTTTGEFADARIPASIARTADVDSANSDLDKRITANADRLDNHGKKIGTLETNVSNHGDRLDDLAALKDRIDELEAATSETGLRDVTNLIPEITTGEVTVSRSGSVVSMHLASVRFGDLSGTTSVDFTGALPVGFRVTPSYMYFKTIPRSTSGAERGFRISKYSAADFYSLDVGDYLNGSFMWTTENRFPTSLPGDPV